VPYPDLTWKNDHRQRALTELPLTYSAVVGARG
jgi:hypothetical protein